MAPEGRAALFADLCRLNTLYMIKRAGSGHIGSSFSSLDIVSWLHLEELGEDDLYFSSKGHDAPGLYAVLLALGRLPFEQLHSLRRLGGLPGHPDVGTPGMVTNTGSLGMGVSKAKGLIEARRLRGEGGRVFVLTGDGELQEGQLWESLPGAVHHRMGELTVIVDHNKLQSDTWVSRVSDLGDLAAKFAAFGWQVARCDGHDFHALRRRLADLAAVRDRPKVLIADTVKGKGVARFEPAAGEADLRLYAYHSGAPGDEDYAGAVACLQARIDAALQEHGAAPLALKTDTLVPPAPPAGRQERLLPAYALALAEQAERDDALVVLDADLARDCGLLPFEERFPDRFIECGIAEQDMVSQAGALALRGMIPVVHSFACFLTARANEQIYNNASEGSRVIYVGSLAGLLPAGPGHSHQAVRDLAAVAGVPGLALLAPGWEAEVALALRHAVQEAPGASYLRLESRPVALPFTPPPSNWNVGQGTLVREGGDGVVFTYGPTMLAQAWWAAEHLAADHGLQLRVVNLPWLNRLDSDWLELALGGCRAVFTLDNHYLEGGLGLRLAAALAGRSGTPRRLHHFAVSRLPLCGADEEVLSAHGLDAPTLARTMAACLHAQEEGNVYSCLA
ncbi:MAG TPA: transketolase [Gammaproteobacteria bacterium]|nr:transketolase [Gammaproteobacteria bacterium]